MNKKLLNKVSGGLSANVTGTITADTIKANDNRTVTNTTSISNTAYADTSESHTNNETTAVEHMETVTPDSRTQNLVFNGWKGDFGLFSRSNKW